MVVLLCVGVVIVGVFAILLTTWLFHVLKREGGMFLGREIDYGAGSDDALLPVERRQNAYLKSH